MHRRWCGAAGSVLACHSHSQIWESRHLRQQVLNARNKMCLHLQAVSQETVWGCINHFDLSFHHSAIFEHAIIIFWCQEQLLCITDLSCCWRLEFQHGKQAKYRRALMRWTDNRSKQVDAALLTTSHSYIVLSGWHAEMQQSRDGCIHRSAAMIHRMVSMTGLRNVNCPPKIFMPARYRKPHPAGITSWSTHNQTCLSFTL